MFLRNTNTISAGDQERSFLSSELSYVYVYNEYTTEGESQTNYGNKFVLLNSHSPYRTWVL